MKFGLAIERAKEGERICRRGWNGKDQFVELAKNISYENINGNVINAEHDAIGNNALAFVGTSGVQIGWLASQADMLAEDWEVYYPSIKKDAYDFIDEISNILIANAGKDRIEISKLLLMRVQSMIDELAKNL